MITKVMRTASPVDLLPRALTGLVRRLPAALLGSVVACLAATGGALLTPGLTPVSVLVQAPLLAAGAAPLLVLGSQLTLDREPSARASWRAVCSAAPRLALLGLVAAIPVALTVVASTLWTDTGAVWVLPCLAVGLGVSVASVLVTAALAPLLAVLPEQRVRALLAVALRVVALRPLPLLGSVAAGGLGVWAGVAWSASLLLLVPAPALVALCAGVWTSVLQLGLARVE